MRFNLCRSILKGEQAPNLATLFMGQDYRYPFGIAPVGMSIDLAAGRDQTGRRRDAGTDPLLPVDCGSRRTPEEVGPAAGDMGWFQLYPARDETVWRDILRRAEAAGFTKLAVTVDVPGESRRERQRRAVQLRRCN